MRRWDSFVEKFIHSLEARNLSEGFVDLNFRELQRFGSWLNHRLNILILPNICR